MSRDINRILLPGEEQTVKATGDYVYCKSATVPVHVAMDQEVTEMVAGDKLRETERFKSFKLENRSPDTIAYVTFVVGDGDYMRQIVQGELAVQPKLMTESGRLREDSRYWLSLYIRPEPAYSPNTYSYGDTVKTFTNVDAKGADSAIEWNPIDAVWMTRNDDGIHREYTEEWAFVREYQGPDSYNGFADQAFTLGPNATTIYYIDDNGPVIRKAPKNNDGSAGTWLISEAPGADDGADIRAGDDLTRVGDVLYYYERDTDRIYASPWGVFAEGNPEWTQVASGVASGAQARLNWDGRYLHATRTNNNYTAAVDLETGNVAYAVDPGQIFEAVGYKGGLLYMYSDGENKVYAKWAGEGPDTINVKAIAEPLDCRRPAGMIDTGAWAFTAATLETSAGLMGEIKARGEIIRAALALYAGTFDAPDNYLDHVYAVRANTGTGQAKQAIRANQTFAAAGLSDNFRMTIPGAIHIQIDALLFNE